VSVLIFSNTLKGISGLDKSIVETARLLAKNNYDVHLINIVGKDAGFFEASPALDLDQKVKLYSLKSLQSLKKSKFISRWKIKHHIKQEFLDAKFLEHDIDVFAELLSHLTSDDFIIFTHPLQSYLYSKLDLKSKAKCLLQIHGNFFAERHNLELLNGHNDKLDYIQVVAPSMSQDLAKELKMDKSRFKFIPNLHIPQKIIKRNNKEKKTVAIIGSLQDRKNQIDAIKMMAYLKEEPIQLKIWGGLNGAYANDLQAYVEAADLSSKIEFMGNGCENEIYQDCDVVIMTSKSEGFSYIMPESASHKIPLVLYDFDYGPRDFVEDNYNGYIVPFGDIEALAHKVKHLLADNSLLETFGSRSFEKYANELNSNTILQGYKDIIGEPNKQKLDLSSFIKPNQSIPFAIKISSNIKSNKSSRFWQSNNFIDEVKIQCSTSTSNVKRLSIHTKNDVKEFPVKQLGNNTISCSIKGLKNKNGIPEKYFAFFKTKDNADYAYQKNLKAQVEINSEMRFSYRKFKKNSTVEEVDHLLCINGLNIRYPSHEMIRSIRNEKGDFLISLYYL